MPSTSVGSFCRSLSPLIAGAAVAEVGLGCDHQVGYVGREFSTSGGTAASAFTSEFQRNDGQWEVQTGLARASVEFARPDPQARDSNVAELLFPGNPNLGASDAVGPDFVTQISTVNRFHYGTLRTRVSFGACDPSESVVQAVLGYFSDGTDANGNGLVDDVEIDFQVSCNAPNYVYLSVFTDYEATGSGERFRKLSHIVDFATGASYQTPADDADNFVAIGTDPKLLRPTLLEPGRFYELGFDWQPTAIRFFLVDGTEELTLWTLDDASHVPQLPVYLMYNLWHPSSRWFPLDGAANFPASDLTMKLDWVRFEAKVP